jgi:hypothetical protein
MIVYHQPKQECLEQIENEQMRYFKINWSGNQQSV